MYTPCCQEKQIDWGTTNIALCSLCSQYLLLCCAADLLCILVGLFQESLIALNLDYLEDFFISPYRLYFYQELYKIIFL